MRSVPFGGRSQVAWQAADGEPSMACRKRDTQETCRRQVAWQRRLTTQAERFPKFGIKTQLNEPIESVGRALLAMSLLVGPDLKISSSTRKFNFRVSTNTIRF